MPAATKPVATDLPPSGAVVEAVAALEGIDAEKLDPPLNDVVDPDALDRLLDGRVSDAQVTFHYRGHEVVVTATGVSVD